MNENEKIAQAQKDIFSANFNYFLNRRGKTQADVAAHLGVTTSTVSDWANAKKYPRVDKMQLLADFFGILMSDLREQKELLPNGIVPMPAMQQLPLLGTIACGEPILADENIEAYINVPEGVHADFVLRCRGDSMINARINDGDIVFIRQQPDVENGEIAAVLNGDGEATLKRVYHHDNTIILQPENPAYPPHSYTGPALEGVRIIGKAVAFLSEIK